jgi:hypothetical protein
LNQTPNPNIIIGTPMSSNEVIRTQDQINEGNLPNLLNMKTEFSNADNMLKIDGSLTSSLSLGQLSLQSHQRPPTGFKTIDQMYEQHPLKKALNNASWNNIPLPVKTLLE